MSFLLNYVEIRVDAYKMLTGVRRPIPVATNSIGTWQNIYLCTAVIAVMTNAGLLVFTLNAFPFDSLGAKVWVFYLFQVRLYHSISSR